MQKVLNKVSDFFHNLWSKETFRAFVYIFVLVIGCLSIRGAQNNFTLPMTGDYTMQTYAFYSQGYKIFWEFVKTGEYPLFDFSNFLGANYLGTQSFYYVFSPLFYILCLCPAKYLYQGIFFHMAFKYALGGFFMYLLLRKYFHVSFKMSWLGGFIYALSGWSLFYIWFHFGDVMAFFPLFIMGIERVLKERKGGLLTISTFLCGMANYFFFINFVIFGVFYALYRWIYIYGINKKRGFGIKERWGVLLQGILFAACGALMAGICIFPSLNVAMASNRAKKSDMFVLSLLETIFVNPSNVDGIKLGEMKAFKDIISFSNIETILNLLFVWPDVIWSGESFGPGNINIGYILSSWLFMNTNCWDNILFNQSSLDNSIGGMFITTPLTMLLIPSIVRVFKTKRPWAIFGVIAGLIIPFLPITMHAAFAFTSLYGRWQIWIVLVGIIFIIPTLDRFEEVDRRLISVNLIFNYLLAAAAFTIAIDAKKLPTDYLKEFLGMEIPGMILIAIAELIVMFVVWAIYRCRFIKAPLVKNIAIVIVIIEIAASTISTVEQKGYHKWENFYLSQPQHEELNELVAEIKENTPGEFYRMGNTESTRSIPNLPSELNYKGAATFNSTYDSELDDFIERAKLSYAGSWMMGNHEKRYWLDQYIGTKYYIIDKTDKNNDNSEFYRDQTLQYDGRQSLKEEKQEYKLNMPWNYERVIEGQYYDVYENKDFIGIGYTVDNYMLSASATKSKSATYYDDLYTNTAIIENDDAEMMASKKVAKKKATYNDDFELFSRKEWDCYFSPREDQSKKVTGEIGRQEFKLEGGTDFTQDEISKHLDGKFFHRRWNDWYYGDKIILKLKDGATKLADKATEDNVCYVNFNFKFGPRVLISFYNGDKLITQDAHSNPHVSLYAPNYERKFQRGFYLDQPADKIIIEFISDIQFSQMFLSKKLPSYSSSTQGYTFDIKYAYQEDIQKKQDEINAKTFKNVVYKNNKFTFTGNHSESKIAVTNIPFDPGWSLKINGEDADIFKVNGGFVGFITPTGEVSYELKYFTPKLKTGLISTGVGLIMFIALFFVYRRKKSDVLALENAEMLPILNDMEEKENKYFKSVNNKINDLIKKIKNNIFEK